jgi:hypothetical protein
MRGQRSVARDDCLAIYFTQLSLSRAILAVITPVDDLVMSECPGTNPADRYKKSRPAPMLTNEEICSRVEAAFTPYRCVAEIWDYGQKLRFRVFGSEDEPLITMEELLLSSARDSASLDSLLVTCRQRISHR